MGCPHMNNSDEVCGDCFEKWKKEDEAEEEEKA